VGFGEAVRSCRERLGLNQAQAARRVPISGAHLSRIEAGGPCSLGTAQAIDRALDAGGGLVALHVATSHPDPQELLHRESERLADMLAGARPGDTVDELTRATDQLSVDYLATPGPGLIDELTTARRQAVDALRARRLRNHHQVRDLTSDVGYLSGILAYAALDAGHPKAALAHADAAWQAAEVVGSDQLRAWVRGTQSLILRFLQRYPEALARAEDGLRYATSGTARARLLAGVGQCHANMGDAPAARRALNAAELAFDEQRGMDEVNGLFTFSRAKLYYYSGSSLIWLEGGADARRARDQAHTAVSMWETAGRERSVADEALAHVYAATGSLQVHDLEEALSDLEPILSLPPERRISWITKRMDRILAMLDEPPYDSDPAAAELRQQIAEYDRRPND
jgi:transcriptional regulator with XRE-family HTH domain